MNQKPSLRDPEREALLVLLYPWGIRTEEEARAQITRQRAIQEGKLVGMLIQKTPTREPVLSEKTGSNVIHVERMFT